MRNILLLGGLCILIGCSSEPQQGNSDSTTSKTLPTSPRQSVIVSEDYVGTWEQLARRPGLKKNTMTLNADSTFLAINEFDKDPTITVHGNWTLLANGRIEMLANDTPEMKHLTLYALVVDANTLKLYRSADTPSDNVMTTFVRTK